MANFCKNEECPASQALLAYQNGDMEVADGREIRKHLAACEFCAAEIEFYEHYPPSEDSEVPPESVKMPEPLFELAEALLNSNRESVSMAKLMSEIDAVSDENL